MISLNRISQAIIVVAAIIIFLGVIFYVYILPSFISDDLLSKEIYYLDTHVSSYPDGFTPTVSEINYVDDNSVIITFNKNDFLIGKYEIPNEFEVIKKIKKGDKFIAMCHDSDLDGVFSFNIFHLIKINNTHAVFDHYQSKLNMENKCKYPEIIENSFNMNWPKFDRIPPKGF